MADTVEKNVNGGTRTASPGPNPRAIKASSRASLPDATPTRRLRAHPERHLIFKAANRFTENELLAVENRVKRGLNLTLDGVILGAEIDQGNAEWIRLRHWC